MKKFFLTSVVMLAALMTQAQTKISPVLTNGYRAVYVEEQTKGDAANQEKTVSETEYVVSDVTADGASITATVLSVETTGGDDDPTEKLMALGSQIMRGISVKLAVNADGEVTGIRNLDEVKARGMELATAMIDELLEQVPQLAQVMPKDALMAQITEGLSEEALIEGFTAGGVLALNGKTPMNGASENVTLRGMKMKRMYFVTGKRIITNSTLDMTSDELKEFVISQVAKVAPDQVEMIRQNIDLVMGQMTMEMTLRSTYELQDNGWVKSVQSEMSENVMGQSSRVVTKITLKE